MKVEGRWSQLKLATKMIKRIEMKALILFLITSLLLSLHSCTCNQEQPIGNPDNDSSFRCYTELKTAVEFWKDIFVKYKLDEVIIHHQDDLSIIYDVVKVPTDNKGNPLDGTAKRRWRQQIIGNYNMAFDHLDLYHQNKSTALTNFHTRCDSPEGANAFRQKLLQLLNTHQITSNYSSLSASLRLQSGLRERFLKGYIESGKYLPDIRERFNREGIPLELCFLPHVESSFNTHAVSRCGAVGLWQLMPDTARQFIEVSDGLDERRDPFKATYAASQYFKKAYQQLGSWELALISYHYGIQGTKRAVTKLNTKDIVTIIQHYQGQSFGFASRNFYTEFLAVKNICDNPEKYLLPVEKAQPLEFDVFVLPHYLNWETLIDDLGLPGELLKELNPQITTAIINKRRRVPQNLSLKIPEGTLDQLLVKYQRLPSSKLHATQISYKLYRVKRGDNLFTIAAKFDTSIHALKTLNHLRGNTIYVNQRLKIPAVSELNGQT